MGGETDRPCGDVNVVEPTFVKSYATKADILWAGARRAMRTLIFGGGGAIILREAAKHIAPQYAPALEVAGAMLGAGMEKSAREVVIAKTKDPAFDWPQLVLKPVAEKLGKKGVVMKTINWVVIATMAFNVILYFIPDFPKEAAVAIVTNLVVLIGYIWHKSHPATP